ncbi:hypothetical protein [Coleofasciculus sp. F4-SAH-05]|uniref:hypothetical protein n=1 Tax=Coleofasciculus sp. F4-SAH-05 TaxID=3069525 RepID=UPI0032FAF6D7
MRSRLCCTPSDNQAQPLPTQYIDQSCDRVRVGLTRKSGIAQGTKKFKPKSIRLLP